MNLTKTLEPPVKLARLAECLSNKRILSVDDDPVLRTLLKKGLESAGYQSFTAGNGMEAMDVMLNEHIDLITVDLLMPFVDGMTFLSWLRNDFQSTVPAIVFTSMEPGEITEKAMESGATEVLAKPIALAKLLEVVGKYIRVEK